MIKQICGWFRLRFYRYRRAQYASMAMAAFCSNQEWLLNSIKIHGYMTDKVVAKQAVNFADALIQELDND